MHAVTHSITFNYTKIRWFFFNRLTLKVKNISEDSTCAWTVNLIQQIWTTNRASTKVTPFIELISVPSDKCHSFSFIICRGQNRLHLCRFSSTRLKQCHNSRLLILNEWLDDCFAPSKNMNWKSLTLFYHLQLFQRSTMLQDKWDSEQWKHGNTLLCATVNDHHNKNAYSVF